MNELLLDLLDEYLQYEYDVLSEHISTVDLKKAVQQIIIHVRPYHIDCHQNHSTLSGDEDAKSSHFEDDDDYDVLPFTFGDLCHLGEWLCEVEEMESEVLPQSAHCLPCDHVLFCQCFFWWTFLCVFSNCHFVG